LGGIGRKRFIIYLGLQTLSFTIFDL
jgi:hypothetical protein